MKEINYFYWYNGQSPLAYCCMELHPEQFWSNVKGVCICGRTERPKWIIEARRKAEQ